MVEGEGSRDQASGTGRCRPKNGQLTATFDNNPQLPFSDLRVAFNSGPTGDARHAEELRDLHDQHRNNLLGVPDAGRAEFALHDIPELLYRRFLAEVGSWDHEPRGRVLFALHPPCYPQGRRTKPLEDLGDPAARASWQNSPASRFARRPSGHWKLSRSIPDRQHDHRCRGWAAAAGYILSRARHRRRSIWPVPTKGPRTAWSSGFPAQAGPFDLGTIAVRVALEVDPFTAQVTATSDPLPQILEGIPVAYRDVAGKCVAA